jgi:hypothetical protein
MNRNQILGQILNNPIKNNPMFKNAFQCLQKDDEKALREMASNLCKEKGIDVNKAEQFIRQKFGL